MTKFVSFENYLYLCIENLKQQMKLEPREIVRAQRRRKGMTQAELAQATGLHKRTIYQFEGGKSDISLQRFIKILEALELSLEILEK